jgi:hypothetical protein
MISKKKGEKTTRRDTRLIRQGEEISPDKPFLRKKHF